EIYDMESMSETHTMLRGEQKEQSRWSRTVLFGLGLLALTAVAVGAAVFSSNNRASVHNSSAKVVQLSEDDVWSAVLSPNAMKQYEQEKAASKEVDKAEAVDKAAAEAAIQREQAASKVEEAMKQAVTKAKATAQQAEDKASATFQAGADKAASAVKGAQAQAESAVKSAQSQAASSMKDAQNKMTEAKKDPVAAAQAMMQKLVGGDKMDQAKDAAAKSAKSVEVLNMEP
ncbi:NLRC3, partial [Symbiodinium sp. KB8]